MSQKHPINISNVVSLENQKSEYLKPFRLYYEKNNKNLFWDCIKTHDSVAILLFNTTRKVFVFVKQFRCPVFLSTLFEKFEISDLTDLNNLKEKCKQLNSNSGYTIELCAGIIDKKLSPQEIAKEEILEETGYEVPVESVKLITTFRTSVGSSGSLQYLYYCEVKDSMRVSDGGGIDDEEIEVVEFSIEDGKKLIYASDQETNIGRPAGFRLAISWFIYEKLPKIK